MLFQPLDLVLGLAILFQAVDGHSYDCGLKRASKNSTSVWPWMVAIVMNYRNEYFVQGSGFLIDHIHVVTSAENVGNPETEDYEARIGNVDHTRGEKYGIVRILNHPGFHHSAYAFYNDIAILTLDRPVTNKDFNPVCLPNKEIREMNLDNLTMSIVGWGENKGGKTNNILQQLRGMPVVPNSECDQIYRETVRKELFELQLPNGITHNMMCAGFPEGGKDPCGSAGGGPLMIKRNDKWYAVGILSFGYGCGHPGVPTGFTRVSEFWDWIWETAWS